MYLHALRNFFASLGAGCSHPEALLFTDEAITRDVARPLGLVEPGRVLSVRLDSGAEI